jgi:GGDEF domain-containing protein
MQVTMPGDRDFSDIIALLSNCLDAFTAALFLWDEQQQVLTLKTSHSLSKHLVTNAQFSLEDGGLIGWVAKNNQAVAVDHFDRDGKTIPYYRSDENIKSFVAVPLPASKGVICVDSKRQYVFTTKEQKLLHGFATVIENILGAERANWRHQQLRQLITMWHRTDALPADTLDPIPYFGRLLEQGCAYLNAEAGVVTLPIKDGKFLQPVAVSGKVPPGLVQSSQPVDQGLIGWIYQNRKSLIVPKFRSRARLPYLFSATDGIGELGALIGMPLAWNPDEVAGVIAFFRRTESAWGKEELGAIVSVVRRATLVLQNFTLRRELALVRNLDPVTEVCNLDAFDRVLSKRLERCHKAGTNLGLAILAIDDLDSLNTRVALPDLAPLHQRISAILLQGLRRRQIMGCLEPGRFAILFEEETPAHIHGHLKAMVAGVQQEVLDQMSGMPRLQARFGFALFPQDAATSRDLWTRAFQALAHRSS